jgi:hypothetical protein
MIYLSLVAAIMFIALVLLLEHYALSKRTPLVTRYALGLVTELFGILAWLTAAGFIAWWLALILFAGACLAGVPVGLLLIHREARERGQWRELVRHDQAQASRLALLEKTQPRDWRRVKELAENLSFTAGAARQEIETLRLFLGQFEKVAEPLVRAVEGNDGTTR